MFRQFKIKISAQFDSLALDLWIHPLSEGGTCSPQEAQASPPVSMQESALGVAQSSDPLRPVWKLDIYINFNNFTVCQFHFLQKVSEC